MPEDNQNMSLKQKHPEWYHATDYHWLDSGPHYFWDEALKGCNYDCKQRQFNLFKE